MNPLTAAAAGLALIVFTAPGLARQDSGGLFSGGGVTDVSAESSDLDQQAGILRLRGDVNVIQDGARLRADAADVFFDTSGQGNEVVRIEAEGDVFYVTPEETVRGDRGVYDVASDTVTMTGEVVLTQGCNVSTGQRLVSELESGRSQLFGSSDGEGGGRVRGLFVSGDSSDDDAENCPRPDVPGDGPLAFDERRSADAPADAELGEEPSERDPD